MINEITQKIDQVNLRFTRQVQCFKLKSYGFNFNRLIHFNKAFFIYCSLFFEAVKP